MPRHSHLMHPRLRNRNVVRRFVVLVLMVGVFLFAGSASSQSEHPSVAAAEAFLEQLDNGAFAQAWEEASSLFRKRVTKQQWLDDIVHLRSEYGQNGQRKLQFMKVLEELSEAPEQTFLYLLFRSEFSVQGSVAESVTMMIDEDRRWRVAGYDIQ